MSQAEHEDVTSDIPSVSRPVSITILAWFLIIGGTLFLLMKPLTWSEFTLERNLWNTFSKGASLVCGIGLLAMRRWAVVLYFGLFALNCVLIYTWPPNETVLEHYSRPGPIAMMMIVPVIIAAITFPRWNAMRW
ncbi:hypothetical protein [Rubripirellula tenax]|nr:hypothetical protein [Rubripirellula tenax]